MYVEAMIHVFLSLDNVLVGLNIRESFKILYSCISILDAFFNMTCFFGGCSLIIPYITMCFDYKYLDICRC